MQEKEAEELRDFKGAEKTEQKKKKKQKRKKREQIDRTVICTMSYLCWRETSSRDPSEVLQERQMWFWNRYF